MGSNTQCVLLEPCSLLCTEKIIAAGIRRVVIGTFDPNPLIMGRGMALLQEGGIEVTLLEDAQAAQLILPFATLMTQQRLYVTAKWAMTLDGKIATSTHDACWISGPESRAWVHNLRDRVDAILLGSGTALDDDPQRTVRLDRIQQHAPERTKHSGPVRRVVATAGKLAPVLKLLRSNLAKGTMIMVGEDCPVEPRALLEGYGVKVCTVPTKHDQTIDLSMALATLAQPGYMHI